MMKKISIALLFIFALCFAATQKSNAQDTKSATQNVTLTVKGTALLAVDGGDITLSLSGASRAGDAAGLGTNSTSKLRLTSLVDAGNTRKITAQIQNLTSGGQSLAEMTMTDTKLTVQLGAPGGNAEGGTNLANFGTRAGAQTLAVQSAVDIMTGITTCWTGSAVGDGLPITYTYSKDGPNPRSASLKIVYTISDTNGDM